MMAMRLLSLAAVTAALTSAATAAATPNTWPFDFDPQLAEDPTFVQAGLNELGQNLPGLRDDELTLVQRGAVTLWLFTGVSEIVERGASSGPGSMPPIVRNPVLCAEHDAFVFPSLLASGSFPLCDLVEQSISNAFDDNDKTCLQVEFPETYVFDHPAGHVDVDVVSSFEGLIAVAGEALSHIDYPAGLLPADFFDKLRPIIAKIRYDKLIQQIDARVAAYANALQELNNNPTCWDPTAEAAFETTVANLNAEMTAAKQQLEQLYQDGLTNAAADRTAMEAQCRARKDLLHPSLTDEERILLSQYIGGIFWRARGAGLLAYPPDPEQGLWRRILYVKYPYQLIGDLTGGEDAAGVGDAILIEENWGWAEWWDMGTTPGTGDKYSDLVYMTKRGKRGADSARPLIEGRGYDIRSLLSGAMQMGPCYYESWEPLLDFRLGENLQDPYMWFLEWPTSTGEFCTGAALAEGLARTMLWGLPIPPDDCEPECPGGSCGGGGAGAGSGTGGGTGASGGAGTSSGAGAGASTGNDAASDDGCACSTPSGHGNLWGFGLLLGGLLLGGARRLRRP